MADIETLTLNPSLDLSAEVPRVVPGPKLRLGAPVEEPGGGGVNVARAIAEMGGGARAIVALGGAIGTRLRQLLARSGLSFSVFEHDGETRQSLAVTETATGQQFRFVLPGAPWPPGLAGALIERLADDARRGPGGGFLVLSGSQPPGVSDEFPHDLVQALPETRVVVDTSGAALRALIARPRAGAVPHVLRMDRAEAEEMAGAPLPRAADSAAFAAALVGRGVARIVVLARGAEGSVLVSPETRLLCRPPSVPVVSKVGAGDSFTGLFTLALARGEPLAQALRLGTAGAAAAVMTPATALCRRADVLRLVPECRLETLDPPAGPGPAPA